MAGKCPKEHGVCDIRMYIGYHASICGHHAYVCGYYVYCVAHEGVYAFQISTHCMVMGHLLKLG